jgi:hypothetical protein
VKDAVPSTGKGSVLLSEGGVCAFEPTVFLLGGGKRMPESDLISGIATLASLFFSLRISSICVDVRPLARIHGGISEGAYLLFAASTDETVSFF